MFCDVEKKKSVLTSSMHSMKSVSLFQAMIYAFIYTAPNYRPKQMQIQCTKKHYRVHRSSAKHSLFIGCMCTQTAIFFFLSTTETTHCTFEDFTWNRSKKWTEMQQTSQRNSYHGELQEITGPAGNVRMATDKSKALRLNGH